MMLSAVTELSGRSCQKGTRVQSKMPGNIPKVDLTCPRDLLWQNQGIFGIRQKVPKNLSSFDLTTYLPSPRGLEPLTFGSGGQRAIHCATGTTSEPSYANAMPKSSPHPILHFKAENGQGFISIYFLSILCPPRPPPMPKTDIETSQKTSAPAFHAPSR